MFKTLKQNIIYGTTYTATELVGKSSDTSIRVLLATYKKGELDIVHTETVYAIEALKNLPKEIKHLQLIITNDQVLSKQLVLKAGLSDTAILNEAFASIDIANFYYEIIPLDEGYSISICRKSYVEACIKNYENEGILVTGWSLGYASMVQYSSLVDANETIGIEELLFTYDQGKLKTISAQANDDQKIAYQIHDFQVPREYVNTLGGVLNYFQYKKGVASNTMEAIEERRSYFKQHRMFSVGLPAAAGVLLLIFLANFLFYNHYFTKVEELQTIGSSNSLQKNLLIQKDSIVNQKQRLFEDVIASSSSASSYFLDRLVAGMPKSILLNRLVYHPLQKKVKENNPLILARNTIEIQGSTAATNDLSTWITALEKMDFVSEVSIKKLDQQGKQSNFNVTISIGE